MSYVGVPVTGVDANGNPIMLMTDNNGSTSAIANTSATNQIGWDMLEISTLVKTNDGKIVGLGIGSNATTPSIKLVWVKDSSGWNIAPSNLSTADIRPYSVEHDSTYYIAVRNQLVSTDLSLSVPAGGGLAVNNSVPVQVSAAAIDGVNSNGTTIVATSLGTIGTWTSGNAWVHSVGPVTYIPTGHLETTYTFPGYTGANAQVQYANTVVSSANVASYGLMGSPQISVTWPA
jgi:hypothetical protein